jgi:hypothetical protein
MERYVGLPETPYRNLMLDRQVLIREKRPTRHRVFLPQKVVRPKVWTWGLQGKHSY